MAAAERPTPSSTIDGKPNAQSILSKEDQEELALLDTTFDHLKKLVPPSPYILSTPSLKPYRHYTGQSERMWMLGHLFTPDEEHLQYRTFLYREPCGDDIFVLQAGESCDEPSEPPKSQSANTPLPGAKKRLTYSAYKAKQASANATPNQKKPSPGPTPPDSSSTPKQLDVNGAAGSDRTVPSSTSNGKEPHKRATSAVITPSKPNKRPKNKHAQDVSPTKPAGADTAAKPAEDRLSSSDGTPHGLPRLLSPVDQHITNPYGLPPILSPTLPSNVQAELDRLTSRERGDSNASNSSAGKKTQPSITSDTQIQEQQFEKTVSRNSTGAPASSAKSHSQMAQSQQSTDGKIGLKRPATEVPTWAADTSSDLTEEESASSPKLVVKLKYGRRNSNTITRLLKLPQPKKGRPVPDKTNHKPNSSGVSESVEDPAKTKHTSKKHPHTEVAKVKSVAKPQRTSSPEVVKRKRTASPESVKRKRTVSPEAVKRKRTASPDAAKRQRTASPAIVHVKSKPPKPTPTSSQEAPPRPKKSSTPVPKPSKNTTNSDLHTTPLKANAGSVITPNTERVDTPQSDKKGPQRPSVKREVLEAQSKLNRRLIRLGRFLKHEVQNDWFRMARPPPKKDEMRVAVKCLECILCYVAAFSLQDYHSSVRGQPMAVDTTWKTLLPLCFSWGPRTKGFWPLEGLRLHLSAVICSTICQQLAMRGTAPDLTTSSTEDDALKKMTHDFQTISEMYVKLVHLQHDAKTSLRFDDLQASFPDTWAKRAPSSAKKPPAYPPKDMGLSLPLKLGEAFHLPPNTLETNPLQTLKFGFLLIQEYERKEKLDYTWRLDIDSPERIQVPEESDDPV
ncbi:hypothetical protein M011DRAFT_490214 [Sporormia fimetaria CBS 119925]|uniref:Uncharacterized protein n=1 Tax=Sporormia fimetaria CBS 119925 TaxID=1340428 RepID=A0A6A6UZQ8_9PLEO|nr:hypothetical protein M011DRAFT_490214 [Sporormia fimetaria CBS 119925]